MSRRRQVVLAAIALGTAGAVLTVVLLARSNLVPSPIAHNVAKPSVAVSAQPAPVAAVQPSPVSVAPPLASGRAVSVVSYKSPNLYSNSQLFGLYARPGTTLTSPLTGKVMVHSGPDPRLPADKLYVLLTITAPDNTELAMFFGALGSDVVPLVADQAQISSGSPLVKITGTGANLWYYGAKGIVPFQAIGFWRDHSGAFVDVAGRPNLFGS